LADFSTASMIFVIAWPKAKSGRPALGDRADQLARFDELPVVLS
jgi:hypothetical protein